VKKNSPAYLELLKNGELEGRAEAAWKAMSSCKMCPHRCGADRLGGESSFCRITDHAILASYGPHFGEEAPLTGRKGSGTIFFSSCNMRCLYCQNYEISHLMSGKPVTPEILAFCFLALQEDGCHNINLVTPSHVVPFILKALVLAAGEGLSIPLVYNTAGYDSTDTLSILDGIIDIYLPDFKYWDKAVAKRLSKVSDYPETARTALREMHRQVGDLAVDDSGIAARGLLVRHLVLPGGLSGTEDIMKFIADEISPETYVNVMEQYRPCGKAMYNPPLDRRITDQEFYRALEAARKAGLTRLDA